MAVSMEKAIAHMYALRAKHVTYSMYGSRIGTDGTADCSGAVYVSLRAGGASNAGWVVNTESEHAWLVANGFQQVAANREWSAKRGDIFIWGRKGASGGAGGHTGIFISHTQIIHCNYAQNGVSIGNHDALWAADGQPYFYAYRYKGAPKVARKAKSGYYTEAEFAKAKNQFLLMLGPGSLTVFHDNILSKPSAVKLAKGSRIYAHKIYISPSGYTRFYVGGTNGQNIGWISGNKKYVKLGA